MNPIRVLYLEDDPAIVEIVDIVLSSAGQWSLTHVENGQLAIEQFQEGFHDLLLFDVMVPKVDGPSAYVRIAASVDGPAPPVIFMTAKQDPLGQMEGIDMERVAVVEKPFDALGLPDELRALWERMSATAGNERLEA